MLCGENEDNNHSTPSVVLIPVFSAMHDQKRHSATNGGGPHSYGGSSNCILFCCYCWHAHPGAESQPSSQSCIPHDAAIARVFCPAVVPTRDQTEVATGKSWGEIPLSHDCE